MQIKASTPDEYISKVPEERKPAMERLRKIIQENLPEGFKEEMSYGMIGYVVPHSRYPGGYHVNPELPLPFLNLASQKNYIALYHSGVYADAELLEWFKAEYPKHAKSRLDMGKSCLRFKKIDDIPYDLIAELLQKITVDDWIKMYEKGINK